ncbi:hypothetical protein RJ640_016926 [Escallonia rubra]|uniref:peptide-methionine (S)-S-oxide reductase n=1 Tax=Escallonia rubra TaxID=112253 RepID=A0AA88R382_9ASTE|nr:hypothetical protein RJ640_016926 [Escallonia rubra]
MKLFSRNASPSHSIIASFLVLTISLALANMAVGIRFPDRISEVPAGISNSQQLRTAAFALGSFWRSEAVFGCLDGVVRTTAGYAGGSKPNPEYRSLGDHAESVQVSVDKTYQRSDCFLIICLPGSRIEENANVECVKRMRGSQESPGCTRVEIRIAAFLLKI